MERWQEREKELQEAAKGKERRKRREVFMYSYVSLAEYPVYASYLFQFPLNLQVL